MQAALKVNRDRAEAEVEARIAKKFNGDDDVKEGASGKDEPDQQSVPMDIEKESTITTSSDSHPQYNFGDGLPSDFKGQYEIMGVVTHKGRSADSGSVN